jgi:hypothetical protein
MFIRQKKDPSGKISIQVIDKSSGKYKVVKTIGSSSSPEVIKRLTEEGNRSITFTAYKIYKGLERLLKEKHSSLSPEKAIKVTKSVFEILVITPSSKSPVKKTILIKDEQKTISRAFRLSIIWVPQCGGQEKGTEGYRREKIYLGNDDGTQEKLLCQSADKLFFIEPT